MKTPIGIYKTHDAYAAYDKEGRTWPVNKDEVQLIKAKLEAGK